MTLDYVRQPDTLVEKLLSKFLNRSCELGIRLQICELIASLIDLYKLITPNLFNFYSRNIRPNQLNVSLMMEYMVRSVHDQQVGDELLAVLKQIMLNFVHNESSDEEMIIGINCITEVCRRAPRILLEDEDSITLLHELMSYSREKNVIHARDESR